MSEYFEAEKKRIVRIDGKNYKLVPEDSKSFETGIKQGAKEELKTIIKKYSNLKYSRIDMLEYCEKRLKRIEKEGDLK